MTGIPRVMQAVLAEVQGEPLRLMQVSTPHPRAGEVLVRIRASGVNPLDTKILAGIAAHARQALPAILGIDMVGIVAAVGKDVKAFREGDAVYGMAGGVGGHPGSLAEYMTVDARLLARKPANFTLREAAVDRLIAAIANGGMTLFASHRARSAHALHCAATMPSSTVLIYGNPKVGTPIMLATLQAALNLPLRALVRELADVRWQWPFIRLRQCCVAAGVPTDAAARLEPRHIECSWPQFRHERILAHVERPPNQIDRSACSMRCGPDGDFSTPSRRVMGYE